VGWVGKKKEQDYVILDFVLILFFCLELGELAVFLCMGVGRKEFCNRRISNCVYFNQYDTPEPF
jgi:hypothetical protein